MPGQMQPRCRDTRLMDGGDSRQTVGQYLTDWLQLQRSQLQPSTLESYRSNVERYLVPALGDVLLDQLTAAQLSAFYARLQHSGGYRSGQPLTLRTVQYCHGVIHKALGDAVRHELLARNVAMNATLPKVDLRGDGVAEIHAWTAEELRRFLDHTRATPRHPLWHLAAATGMRRGELLGLRWDDVDLAGRALSVRRALSVIKHDARLKQPKTSRCRTQTTRTPRCCCRRASRSRSSASASATPRSASPLTSTRTCCPRWTPTRRTDSPPRSSACSSAVHKSSNATAPRSLPLLQRGDMDDEHHETPFVQPQLGDCLIDMIPEPPTPMAQRDRPDDIDLPDLAQKTPYVARSARSWTDSTTPVP